MTISIMWDFFKMYLNYLVYLISWILVAIEQLEWDPSYFQTRNRKKKPLNFLDLQTHSNFYSFPFVSVCEGSTLLQLWISGDLSRSLKYYTAESLWEKKMLKMRRLWFCRDSYPWLLAFRCISSTSHCQVRTNPKFLWTLFLSPSS